MNEHFSTASVLLAVGTDINHRSKRSRSTLDFAAGTGHTGLVKTILEHGADVSDRSNRATTVLHWYACSDHQATVDMFLDAGADMNARADGDTTPLPNSLAKSSTKALDTLLRRGADATIVAWGGRTALHFAGLFNTAGLEAQVDLLLRWGASESIVNDDGKTPADILGKPRLPHTTSPCPAAEVARVGLLLERAPADGASPRRCWLVMLCSRAERERTPRQGGNSGGQWEGGAAQARLDGQTPKTTGAALAVAQKRVRVLREARWPRGGV